MGVCTLGVASMLKLRRKVSKSPQPAHLACDIRCQRAVRLGTGESAMHGSRSSASSEEVSLSPVRVGPDAEQFPSFRPFQILSPRISSPQRPSLLPKPTTVVINESATVAPRCARCVWYGRGMNVDGLTRMTGRFRAPAIWSTTDNMSKDVGVWEGPWQVGSRRTKIKITAK